LATIAIYAVLFLTLHSKQSPPWEFSGISALTTAQSKETVARPFLMMQSTPTQGWDTLNEIPSTLGLQVRKYQFPKHGSDNHF